jgi:hypothetical protein
VSIVRSMKSHEVVHFRGQYYTQAGRPLNPAQAQEIPSVGSVIAHEMEAAAGGGYVSHLHWLQPGYVRMRRAVHRISASAPFGARHQSKVGLEWAVPQSTARRCKVLEERYRLLNELDRAMASSRTGRDRSFTSFRDFQQSAYQVLGDARWPQAFQMSKEERERYGDNEVGLGCLLARNLIQADAGTRYIHSRTRTGIITRTSSSTRRARIITSAATSSIAPWRD